MILFASRYALIYTGLRGMAGLYTQGTHNLRPQTFYRRPSSDYSGHSSLLMLEHRKWHQNSYPLFPHNPIAIASSI